MPAAKKDIETPEEQVVRAAAEVHAQTANPDAAQPVEKQDLSAKDDKAFEGQDTSNDSFTVRTGDNYGRPLVKISPRNWVGDAPLVIHGSQLADLISALKGIKNAPKAPELPESNADTGGDDE